MAKYLSLKKTTAQLKDRDWLRPYDFDGALRKLCRRLNIPERSFHKLRKTYSSFLLQNGVPKKVVQKQLGHSDIKTTQRYYNYDILNT